MEVDKFGNVRLIDRDTGKPHVCCAASAREILAMATPSADGDPRYVLEANWDRLSVEDSKKAKAEAAKVAAAAAREAEAAAVEAERAKVEKMVEAEIARRIKAGALVAK